MGKKAEKITFTQDFAFSSDADLNTKISTFRSTHEDEKKERIAMDSRRELGPGKVRVTFRVVGKR